MASVDVSAAPPRRAPVSLPWLLATAVPVALFVLFAMGHVANWHKTGHFTGVLLVAQESVFVVLFVVRRPPLETSPQAMHWFVAFGGSFSILLLRPSAAPGSHLVEVLAMALQVAGACASIVCLTGLGRSFGIVAANRGLKVGGPYRIVRHPIYTSYLISWAGYALASPTLRNALVLAVSVLFQLRRIASEELVLSRDGAYRSYRERVAHRLIPGVY